MMLMILMYNLIEYRNNYSKTSWILWQYWRDGLSITANAITDFTVANTITDSFKIKEKKITGKTDNDHTKNVEIMVLLKYISCFPRTLEMSVTYCEIKIGII